MREPPPAQLAAVLSRLGLVSPRDLENAEASVHRMAGDLPRFESVWIDALRQARLLTHLQAAELHAGRGESLAVGRYVLCHSVQECGYAAIYRAEDRTSRESVRLAVFPLPDQRQQALLAGLKKLVAAGKKLPRYHGTIADAGSDGARGWVAAPWLEGTPAAEWMLHHGRIPPAVVLEIARAMLTELAALESAGLIHGDIRAENILIVKDGEVFLPLPGLRALIRPHEGIADGSLTPDACNGLAPERVAAGSPPTTASDLFACGCAWWQMLCGRPPLGGGDTMSRLRAAQTCAIDDLHRWAAEVPDLLVEAIRDCLQKDPHRRPHTMAELAGRLGPLRRQGRQHILRCLAAAAEPRAPWLRKKGPQTKKKTHPHRLTVAAIALLAIAAVAWPIWVARGRPGQARQARLGNDAPQVGKKSDQARAPGTPGRPDVQPPIVDAAVIPAGYAAAAAQSRETRNELRLPGNRAVRGDSLQFSAGQRVRGQGGQARVVVPHSGLIVHAERLSFENIDFVADEETSPPAERRAGPPSLIRLSAAECDFVHCSFQSAPASPELSVGIAWDLAPATNSAAPPRAAPLALASGRVRMRDCVFRRVAAAIESRACGAVTLEAVNCLHLGPGPMLRVARAPAADEPVHLLLSQVTLREAESLLDCRAGGGDESCGEITVQASGCVLAPRAEAALLNLTCDTFPQQLLTGVKWTGQGSVVAGRVVFGSWSRANGVRQTIDDSTLSVAGLVRGDVEFAARFDGSPASSQVVNCQAPLQDTESAGAAVSSLPRDITP